MATIAAILPGSFATWRYHRYQFSIQWNRFKFSPPFNERAEPFLSKWVTRSKYIFTEPPADNNCLNSLKRRCAGSLVFGFKPYTVKAIFYIILEYCANKLLLHLHCSLICARLDFFSATVREYCILLCCLLKNTPALLVGSHWTNRIC